MYRRSSKVFWCHSGHGSSMKDVVHMMQKFSNRRLQIKREIYVYEVQKRISWRTIVFNPVECQSPDLKKKYLHVIYFLWSNVELELGVSFKKRPEPGCSLPWDPWKPVAEEATKEKREPFDILPPPPLSAPSSFSSLSPLSALTG